MLLCFLVHGADAWPHAPVDEVLQTGPFIGPGYGLGARPVGEQLLQQVHGLAYRARAGEGPEIAGSVCEDSPGEIDLRELFPEVYLDVGIGLVVLEPGVEDGAVLVEGEVLEEQRLLYGLRHDVIEVGDEGDRHLDL